MCFHMLNLCWPNTKRFLSVLDVSGKYFAFAKIVKIFKNSVALFWRISRRLVQSHAPVASSHRDFSWLTSRSMSQSQKILRKIFKNLGFYVSRGSVWQLVRGWKVQSRGVHRDFCDLPRDFLVGRLSNREKHLEKFSDFWFLSFSRLVLATCARLGSVAKITCFAYWGLLSRSFSKNFHFSLMCHYHCLYLHLLPSFLIDSFVYLCQKGGEYTISCAHLQGEKFYFLCAFVGGEIHCTCSFITCYTLKV